MAGDWIKMQANLHECPEVVRISSALDADTLRVVGALHVVWCLFDAHTESGFLPGYSFFPHSVKKPASKDPVFDMRITSRSNRRLGHLSPFLKRLRRKVPGIRYQVSVPTTAAQEVLQRSTQKT